MNNVLNTIVPFIVGLAVLVIIWGIFGYISKAGEEEKRTEARMFIVRGVVGVFLMLSVWGLVNILDNSFNLSKTAPARDKMPHLPAIPQCGEFVYYRELQNYVYLMARFVVGVRLPWEI